MSTSTSSLTYEHGAVSMRGHLITPEADDPRPAVVIAHAWKGQGELERRVAGRLAEMGYVALAADVYGDGRYASSPEEAAALMQPLVDDRAELRARIRAAVDAVRGDERVDAGRIAAIGYCFGGLTVLELARSGADVRGVVSFHGILEAGNVANAETITSKVLVLHPYDDPLAPPSDVEALATELDAVRADWQVHMYGGTLHAFTNPEADQPDAGLQYSEPADRRSWTALGNFLDEVFRG